MLGSPVAAVHARQAVWQGEEDDGARATGMRRTAPHGAAWMARVDRSRRVGSVVNGSHVAAVPFQDVFVVAVHPVTVPEGGGVVVRVTASGLTHPHGGQPNTHRDGDTRQDDMYTCVFMWQDAEAGDGVRHAPGAIDDRTMRHVYCRTPPAPPRRKQAAPLDVAGRDGEDDATVFTLGQAAMVWTRTVRVGIIITSRNTTRSTTGHGTPPSATPRHTVGMVTYPTAPSPGAAWFSPVATGVRWPHPPRMDPGGGALLHLTAHYVAGRRVACSYGHGAVVTPALTHHDPLMVTGADGTRVVDVEGSGGDGSHPVAQEARHVSALLEVSTSQGVDQVDGAPPPAQRPLLQEVAALARRLDAQRVATLAALDGAVGLDRRRRTAPRTHTPAPYPATTFLQLVGGGDGSGGSVPVMKHGLHAQAQHVDAGGARVDGGDDEVGDGRWDTSVWCRVPPRHQLMAAAPWLPPHADIPIHLVTLPLTASAHSNATAWRDGGDDVKRNGTHRASATTVTFRYVTPFRRADWVTHPHPPNPVDLDAKVSAVYSRASFRHDSSGHAFPIPLHPAAWARLMADMGYAVAGPSRSGPVDSSSEAHNEALPLEVQGVRCRWAGALTTPAFANPALPGFVCLPPDATALQSALGIPAWPDLTPWLLNATRTATGATQHGQRFQAHAEAGMHVDTRLQTWDAMVEGDRWVPHLIAVAALQQLGARGGPDHHPIAPVTRNGAAEGGDEDGALDTVAGLASVINAKWSDARFQQHGLVEPGSMMVDGERQPRLGYPLRIQPHAPSPPASPTSGDADDQRGGGAGDAAGAQVQPSAAPSPLTATDGADGWGRGGMGKLEGNGAGPPPLRDAHVRTHNDLVASTPGGMPGTGAFPISPNPAYLSQPEQFDGEVDGLAHDVMAITSNVMGDGPPSQPLNLDLVQSYVAGYALARVANDGLHGDTVQALTLRLCDALNHYVAVTCPPIGVPPLVADWDDGTVHTSQSQPLHDDAKTADGEDGVAGGWQGTARWARRGCLAVGTLLRVKLPQCVQRAVDRAAANATAVVPPPRQPSPEQEGVVGRPPWTVQVDISVDGGGSWVTLPWAYTYHDANYANLTAMWADAAPSPIATRGLQFSPVVGDVAGGSQVMVGPLGVDPHTGMPVRCPGPTSLVCRFGSTLVAAEVEAGNLWRLFMNDVHTPGLPVVGQSSCPDPTTFNATHASGATRHRPSPACDGTTTVLQRAVWLAAVGIRLHPPMATCVAPPLPPGSPPTVRFGVQCGRPGTSDRETDVDGTAFAWQPGAFTYVARMVPATLGGHTTTAHALMAVVASQSAAARQPPWQPVLARLSASTTVGTTLVAVPHPATPPAGRVVTLLVGRLPSMQSLPTGEATVTLSSDGGGVYARRADTSTATLPRPASAGDGARSSHLNPHTIPQRDALWVHAPLFAVNAAPTVLNLTTRGGPAASEDAVAVAAYTITSLTPGVGAEHGGTVVTGTVRGVAGGSRLLCRFGVAIVPATFVPGPPRDAYLHGVASDHHLASMAHDVSDTIHGWRVSPTAHVVGGEEGFEPLPHGGLPPDAGAASLGDLDATVAGANGSMVHRVRCTAPAWHAAVGHSHGAAMPTSFDTVPFAISVDGGDTWSVMAGTVWVADGAGLHGGDGGDSGAPPTPWCFSYYAAAHPGVRFGYTATPHAASRIGAGGGIGGGAVLVFPAIALPSATRRADPAPTITWPHLAGVPPPLQPRCRFAGVHGVVVVGIYHHASATLTCFTPPHTTVAATLAYRNATAPAHAVPLPGSSGEGVEDAVVHVSLNGGGDWHAATHTLPTPPHSLPHGVDGAVRAAASGWGGRVVITPQAGLISGGTVVGLAHMASSLANCTSEDGPCTLWCVFHWMAEPVDGHGGGVEVWVKATIVSLAAEAAGGMAQCTSPPSSIVFPPPPPSLAPLASQVHPANVEDALTRARAQVAWVRAEPGGSDAGGRVAREQVGQGAWGGMGYDATQRRLWLDSAASPAAWAAALGSVDQLGVAGGEGGGRGMGVPGTVRLTVLATRPQSPPQGHAWPRHVPRLDANNGTLPTAWEGVTHLGHAPFTYHLPLTVKEVAPAAVHAQGGAAVHVALSGGWGAGVAVPVWVRFGSVIVAAMPLEGAASTSAQPATTAARACPWGQHVVIAPPLAPGWYTVSVSPDGQHFAPSPHPIMVMPPDRCRVSLSPGLHMHALKVRVVYIPTPPMLDGATPVAPSTPITITAYLQLIPSAAAATRGVHGGSNLHPMHLLPLTMQPCAGVSQGAWCHDTQVDPADVITLPPSTPPTHGSLLPVVWAVRIVRISMAYNPGHGLPPHGYVDDHDGMGWWFQFANTTHPPGDGGATAALVPSYDRVESHGVDVAAAALAAVWRVGAAGAGGGGGGGPSSDTTTATRWQLPVPMPATTPLQGGGAVGGTPNVSVAGGAGAAQVAGAEGAQREGAAAQAAITTAAAQGEVAMRTVADEAVFDKLNAVATGIIDNLLANGVATPPGLGMGDHGDAALAMTPDASAPAHTFAQQGLGAEQDDVVRASLSPQPHAPWLAPLSLVVCLGPTTPGTRESTRGCGCATAVPAVWDVHTSTIRAWVDGQGVAAILQPACGAATPTTRTPLRLHLALDVVSHRRLMLPASAAAAPRPTATMDGCVSMVGSGVAAVWEPLFQRDPPAYTIVTLRLVPVVMARSPTPFPATLLAWHWFQPLVVSDVAHATGTHTAAWSLARAHPPTGIITLRCLVPGDPQACVQARTLLLSLASSPTSMLYQGAVTWACDPLFPAATLQLDSDGHPLVNGTCTNPTLLTAAACLGAGSCSCTGIPPDDRSGCESAVSAGGSPCRFTPTFQWVKGGGGAGGGDGGTIRLSYGECSDPRHLTRDDCLADGVCSDPALPTRAACEAAGRCRPPADMEAQVAAGATIPILRFGQFTNKLTCESPHTRPPRIAGRCVVTPGGPPDYPYGQHVTQETCEVPSTRTLPVGIRHVRGFGCVDPVTHDQVRRVGAGGGYDFGVHATQQLCERPETRPPCAKPALPPQLPVLLQDDGWRTAATVPQPGDAHLSWRREEAEGIDFTRLPPYYQQQQPGGGQGELRLRSSQIDREGAPPPTAARPQPAHVDAPPPSSCGPVGLWMYLPGPTGRWVDVEEDGGGVPSGDAEDLAFQYSNVAGVWEPANSFNPTNKWTGGSHGAESAHPCPCHWQANKYHLSKCNWWTCGPPAKGIASDGYVNIMRNKNAVEMVSDYQSFVNVGGRQLWMNLDTGTPTSWAMSVACFFEGCLQTQMFAGMFIPAIPPMVVVIDLLERGLLQIGSMIGFLGHTFLSIGGKFCLGAPLAMGFLDIGNIGEMSYNHTGAIGFAFWEENWPNWLNPRDPMLSVLDFMRCGSIFFPIPMVPLPIPKPFQLWPLPPFFPSGYVFKFAFFYSDRGGCFFMNGAPRQFARTSLSTIMLVPIGIKFLAPSWMFFLNDIRINGRSIRPCLIPPLCRATIRTGQFSITGPMFPMLAVLEEVAAPSTCENVDNLPPITFVINGRDFTMTKDDYVMFGQNFDDVQCVTAFTPEAQLIPGLELWVFGDAFIRAFYAVFHELPFRKLELGEADHRYYEKNGCGGGEGKGPLVRWKTGGHDDAAGGRGPLEAVKKQVAEAADAGMHWKRRQNWRDDLAGQAAAQRSAARDAAMGPPFGRCRPARPGEARFAAGGEQDCQPAHGDEQQGGPGRSVLGIVSVVDTLPTRGMPEGIVTSATQAFGLEALMADVPANVGPAGGEGVMLERATGPTTPTPSTVGVTMVEALRQAGTLDDVMAEVRAFQQGAAQERARVYATAHASAGGGPGMPTTLAELSANPVVAAALVETHAWLAKINGLEREDLVRHHRAAASTGGVGGGGPSIASWFPDDGSAPHLRADWDWRHESSRAHLRTHPDPWVRYASQVHPMFPDLAMRVDEEDPMAVASLHANMTVLYAHMALAMNVSHGRISRYWRGESEEWQAAALARYRAQYVAQLRQAQREFRAHDAAVTTTLQQLKAYVADIRTSPRQRQAVLDAALIRMGVVEDGSDDIVHHAPTAWRAAMAQGQGWYPFNTHGLDEEEGVAGEEEVAPQGGQVVDDGQGQGAEGGGVAGPDEPVIRLDDPDGIHMEGGGDVAPGEERVGHDEETRFQRYAAQVLNLMEAGHTAYQRYMVTGSSMAERGLKAQDPPVLDAHADAQRLHDARESLLHLQQRVRTSIRRLRARRGGQP